MDTKTLRQWKKYRKEIEDSNSRYRDDLYFEPIKPKWENFLDWLTKDQTE